MSYSYLSTAWGGGGDTGSVTGDWGQSFSWTVSTEVQEARRHVTDVVEDLFEHPQHRSRQSICTETLSHIIQALPMHSIIIEEMCDDAPHCTICLVKLVLGDDIRTLTCKHMFHAKCVDTWLIVEKTCPSCRFNVVDGCYPQADNSAMDVVVVKEEKGHDTKTLNF